MEQTSFQVWIIMTVQMRYHLLCSIYNFAYNTCISAVQHYFQFSRRHTHTHTILRSPFIASLKQTQWIKMPEWTPILTPIRFVFKRNKYTDEFVRLINCSRPTRQDAARNGKFHETNGGCASECNCLLVFCFAGSAHSHGSAQIESVSYASQESENTN